MSDIDPDRAYLFYNTRLYNTFKYVTHGWVVGQICGGGKLASARTSILGWVIYWLEIQNTYIYVPKLTNISSKKSIPHQEKLDIVIHIGYIA